MSCDPNDLSRSAACFTCMNPKQLEAVKVYLLCQIFANGGGGGGSGSVLYSPTGDPEGVLIGERPALAYDDNGGLWEKTGAGSSSTGWVPLIAPVATMHAMMSFRMVPAADPIQADILVSPRPSRSDTMVVAKLEPPSLSVPTVTLTQRVKRFTAAVKSLLFGWMF